MLRFGIVVLAALCLTACDGAPSTKGDLKQEREERLDTDDALRGELRSLADRVERLEIEKRMADKHPAQAPAAAESQTSKLLLKAQLKQMTAEGACGQEPPERLPNGGVIFRNSECTEKDLR